MEKEKMPNVTVLIENEKYRSEFLKDLGEDPNLKYLCRAVTRRTSYDFQVFGLLTVNDKLTNYIKTNGIVILFTSVSNYVLDRINKIVHDNSQMPILFVHEKLTNGLCDSYIDLPAVLYKDISNRKLFTRDYMKIDQSDAIDSINTWFNKLVHTNFELTQNNIQSQILITSRNISIVDMVKQFENNTLALTLWDHYGRLRLVNYSVMVKGYNDSINPNGWLMSKWKNYKTSIGHGDLWHYTLTRFWINIIYNLQRKSKNKPFKELYENYPEIQNGKLFTKFYSNDILFTQTARNSWVPPNLLAITF